MLIGARNIRALNVKCNNKDDGCEWMGELRELETHLQSCDYAFVPCTNNCKDPSDSSKVKKVLASDMARHLAEECPRREYKCSLCSQTGEFEQMADHKEKCPRVRVSCPNHPCRTKLLRCNVVAHLTSCKFEAVTCKFASVGCDERPLRKDLSEHEEDSQFHLQITTEKVLDLSKKVTELTRKYTPVVLKFHNFQNKRNENGFFCSPPFYTSPTGYEMFLEVDANGNGDGKGTHVSVFACLMKGHNDDSLTWPFTGTVTFELLNQLEDKNHYKKTVIFPADSQPSRRVVDGERGKQGWGYPQFISHTDLEHQPHMNRQYLKDDTLVFRVSVKVPDYKPWLECAK